MQEITDRKDSIRMKYSTLLSKLSNATSALNKKFFGQKSDHTPDQSVQFGHGIIHEGGHPVGLIEKIEGGLFIMDATTNERVFIYEDGAVYSEYGHKLGRIIRYEAPSLQHKTHGNQIAFDRKAKNGLKFVAVS